MSNVLSNLLPNMLLNIAAIGGAICLALVACALVFQVSLVLFKTGSMSPTIPAGSIAVVRKIPASHVKVGNIVTVDRPGLLPISHRVRTVHPGIDGTTVITMRGDANATDDPAPYTVRTVRIVMWSVPYGAHLLARTADPRVIGGLTLLVAGLVTWTLWPTAQPVPATHRQESSRSRC